MRKSSPRFSKSSFFSWLRWLPAHLFSVHRVKRQGWQDGEAGIPGENAVKSFGYLHLLQVQAEQDMALVKNGWEQPEAEVFPQLSDGIGQVLLCKEQLNQAKLTYAQRAQEYELAHGAKPLKRRAVSPAGVLVGVLLLMGEAIFNVQVFEAFTPNTLVAYGFGMLVACVIGGLAFSAGKSLKQGHRVGFGLGLAFLSLILAGVCGMRYLSLVQSGVMYHAMRAFLSGDQVQAAPMGEAAASPEMVTLGWALITVGMAGLIFLKSYLQAIPKDLEAAWDAEEDQSSAQRAFDKAVSGVQRLLAQREKLYKNQRTLAIWLQQEAERVKGLYVMHNIAARKGAPAPQALEDPLDLTMAEIFKEENPPRKNWTDAEQKLTDMDEELSRQLTRLQGAPSFTPARQPTNGHPPAIVQPNGRTDTSVPPASAKQPQPRQGGIRSSQPANGAAHHHPPGGRSGGHRSGQRP